MSDYTQRETVTVASTPTIRPKMDINYIKTLPGIFKIIELILSFIVFICSVAECSWRSNAGWSAFVAFTAFIITAALLTMNILQVHEAYPQIPFRIGEFIFYATWTFFYLTAASCLAALAAEKLYYWRGLVWWTECNNASAAGSFFGFVAMIIFGVDAFLKFRAWRNEETVTTTRPGPTAKGMS